MVRPVTTLDLDRMTAEDWTRGIGLAQLAERSIYPAFHGFYFQDARTVSAAAIGAMAAHGFSSRTLTIPGGLSRLTDALASRLDVRTGTTVAFVEEDAFRVAAHTDSGVFRAEAAIVAVPRSGSARRHGSHRPGESGVCNDLCRQYL